MLFTVVYHSLSLLYFCHIYTTEQLQHKIVDIFVGYFKTVSESKMRRHFSTVYQILDEVVDGGFPYTTEPNQLQQMITPPTMHGALYQMVSGKFGLKEDMPTGALSKMPWRRDNVKYVTNEIYFDLVEQIDATFSASNNLLFCSIFGEIRANCKLSGQPDLTLLFNKPSSLDDVSLHRSVRINRYKKERVLSFIPPDGHFKLCSYRINGNVQIPIYVTPSITYNKGQGRVSITVGTKFTKGKNVTNVVIILPLPKDTVSSSLTANVGSVSTDTRTQVVKWNIGKIPKNLTPVLEGGITMPLDYVVDEYPVIRAEFQVKMYCASGLRVDGLAIRKVKYKPSKFVRCITQAGRFQIRTG
jgi:AP-3 complex subunit mu